MGMDGASMLEVTKTDRMLVRGAASSKSGTPHSKPGLEPSQQLANVFTGGTTNDPLDRWPLLCGAAIRFAMGFVLVCAIGATTFMLLPRRFESSATIVMHPAEAVDNGGNPVNAGTIDDNTIQSEIDVIGSREMLGLVVNRLGLEQDPEFNGSRDVIHKLATRFLSNEGKVAGSAFEDVRTRVQRRMTVVHDRRSYTIRLGFSSEDPAKAARLAGTLLDTYAETRMTRRRTTLERRGAWLDARATALRTIADRSENKLRSFLMRSGLVDTGTDLAVKNQLTSLSGDLAQVKVRAIEADTRAESLDALQQSDRLDQAPEILASSLIQRLRDAVASAAAKPGSWASESQALQAEISREASRIVGSARTEASSLHERERRLELKLRELGDLLVARDRDGLTLTSLRRDADSDRAAYEDVLGRLRAETAHAASLSLDVDVIDRPEIHRNPMAPNLMFSVLMIVLASSVAGALPAWRWLVLARADEHAGSLRRAGEGGPFARSNVFGQSLQEKAAG